MVGPNTLLASSNWIKRNMLGVYSEKLGRPLTEAEMRVQRCLEQLQVPDWYTKYSRQTKFLKNDTPFECRPPSWKTVEARSPKKLRSPDKPAANATEKAQASANRGDNSSYRISRKADKPRDDERLSISISPSSSDSEPLDESNEEEEFELPKSLRSPLNASHSFPRVQPSRKIQNINIVFERPWPVDAANGSPRTLYTLTKQHEVQEAQEDSRCCANSSRSHASFLFAEVEACGVTNTMHVFAGMDSDEERDSPSPDSRFFNSLKKSSELERIVRSNRRHGGLVRGIVDELERSLAESSCDARRAALEPTYDSCSDDSDLAKSTSISFKSDDDDDEEEPSRSPLPRQPEQPEEEEEEEVFWIASKISELPRTSSRLSMMSRGSSRSGFQCTSGRCSPGLSPIKSERARDDWSSAGLRPRQLFRIDETAAGPALPADSGCHSAASSNFTSSAASSPALATPTPPLAFNSILV